MQTLTIAAEGIYGFYHEAPTPADRGKAVIVLGGSEGGKATAKEIGKLFAQNGIPALSLCYWNMPGLPDSLIKIPVEIMEKAIEWLKRRGYQKIAVYGLSKGAEYALLSASLIFDIRCVVAVSPSFCVFAGLKGGRNPLRKGFADASSFTWRGKPLPYVAGRKDMIGTVKRLFSEQQINMRFMYERALESMGPEAIIKAEDINGPILLQAADADSIWPSRYSGEQIIVRLKEYGFGHPSKLSIYECSHILTPIAIPLCKVFKIERTHPENCAESRREAFKEALNWIGEC